MSDSESEKKERIFSGILYFSMTINGLYPFKKIMPSKKLLISHSWNLSSSLHSDF